MRGLVVLLLLAAVTSPSQPNRTAEMLGDWADAVVQHRAGEFDEALSKIADWTYNDLETMQPFLEAFVGMPERNEDRRAAVRRARLTRRDWTMIREASKNRLGPDATRFDDARRCSTLMRRCSSTRRLGTDRRPRSSRGLHGRSRAATGESTSSASTPSIRKSNTPTRIGKSR